jgi:hypothetical protein
MGMWMSKMPETDGGIRIPPEYGIDGFRELSAAQLVDAARVDPGIVEAATEGQFARLVDLGQAILSGTGRGRLAGILLE